MENLNNYLKNIFDLFKNNEFEKALELCEQNNQKKLIILSIILKEQFILKKKN